jgi:tetratricopeptide (TPR) repeat protein
MVMARLRIPFLPGLVAALVLAGLAPSFVRADDDAALRRRALALNDITGDNPIKGEIKALVDDPAGSKKLFAVARRMAKEKEQPFNYNGAFILARAALQLKDLDTSQAFYRVCAEQASNLQSAQKLVQAYSGLMAVIELLYIDKQYAESAKLSQEFLEMLERQGVSPVFKERVLRHMIQSLAKQGKAAEANKLVENLIKARGDDWRNLRLKAWLANERADYGEAAKLYEDVLQRIPKDESIEKDEKAEEEANVRYILSAVYVDLDQVNKAAEHLKTLLNQYPNNPTFNNDLGYIWADHDQNLDESERLIRKALDEDRKLRKEAGLVKPEDNKDNAAYLDSMGWVLFKKKKYEEAKKYLLEAVQDKDGQHIEIMDHLADVYMALGQKTDAVATWKKAAQLPAPTKREQQKKTTVEKKLKANQ